MKINQLKAGVILSYISEAVSILSGLIYTPIMLRILGQSEYGLYQLSNSVIAYLSLFGFGFGYSYIRYYSQYKTKNDTDSIKKLNGMFMTIFIVIGVVSVLAGSALVLNTDAMFRNSLTPSEIGTAKILMGFMIFNVAISFPSSVFSSYVTAKEQYVFQRVVVILRNLLNPFLTIPLLLLGYKSISLVIIQTVLSVLAFLANFVFCKNKLGMSFDFKGFDGALFKDLALFSFWIFLNQIIDQVNWNVDKFILGVVGGTITVAIYGVAAQLNNLYINFSTSISGVFIPKINKMVAEGEDNKTLTDLFARVGRLQFVVLGLILSGLVIFGRYFISIWAGEGYRESYRVILLLAAPATVSLIQTLGITIQQAKNMHHFRSIVYMVMSVINVAVSIPLSKQYGAEGAALGTAFSMIIGNGIIMNIFYHKKIGLDIIYFWKQILKFIPALVLPCAVGAAIMIYVTYSGVAAFAAWVCVYTLIYTASMWVLGLNKSEKKLFTDPIAGLIRKRRNGGGA